MMAGVCTGLDWFLDLETLKYSSSSSDLLFCCFFHPLSWDGEAPCPTSRTLDSAACVSGATLKREPRSFGDEERGHMFGTPDNGGEEEQNSKAQQDAPQSAEAQTSGRDVHPNSQNVPELIFIRS